MSNPKKTPAKIFSITKDAGINRMLWYLILVVLLSAFCFLTLNVWLLPYSIAFSETGKMTAGYLLYAAIGILFSTPTPFVAVLILSLFIERNGLKDMFSRIFRTAGPLVSTRSPREPLSLMVMTAAVYVLPMIHPPIRSSLMSHIITGFPRLHKPQMKGFSSRKVQCQTAFPNRAWKREGRGALPLPFVTFVIL